MSEIKYLSVKETIKLPTEEDRREQVKLRRNIQSEMVGTLYPAVLEDEIHQILSSLVIMRSPGS